MKEEIVYLMSGVAHLHYLVPSLYTLRDHYNGPVIVYAYPESYSLVSEIARDPRLNVIAKPWNPVILGTHREKNSQFLNKLKLMQSLNSHTAVYLDADTTIHGRLDLLFGMAETYGFVATQFNLWESKGGVIRARLERLKGTPKVCQESLQLVIDHAYPSLNGGIFACSPKSSVLPLWYEWSHEARDIFIADECCLHVLQAFVPATEFHVVKGGRFNCSHKYQDSIRDPIVYHYHGDSNLRPDKSPRAYEFWWPIYEDCIKRNIGHIDDWKDMVPNKWLTLLKKKEVA